MTRREENAELTQQFPEHYRSPYEEALGDDEPVPEPQYGKCRVVSWIPQYGVSHEEAVQKFTDRGVKFEHVFQTARYWCAAVYE